MTYKIETQRSNMNAQELYTDSGIPTGVFACSRCQTVTIRRKEAEACCICTHCGKPLDRKAEFATMHKTCWSKHRQKITEEQFDAAEIVEQYDGWVYDVESRGVNDGFFQDAGEAEDWFDDDDLEDRPEFLLCCTQIPFPVIDATDIASRSTEDFYDGAFGDLEGMEELKAACEAFNAANKHIVSYDPDWKRKVRLGS